MSNANNYDMVADEVEDTQGQAENKSGMWGPFHKAGRQRRKKLISQV